MSGSHRGDETSRPPRHRDVRRAQAPTFTEQNSPEWQRLNQLEAQIQQLQEMAETAKVEKTRAPLPLDKGRDLIDQLWEIENAAVYADRMHLAGQAVRAAKHLLDLYPPDAQMRSIFTLLSDHYEASEKARFHMPPLKALLGGDRPLIQAFDDGSFHVDPSADLLPWAEKIIALGREWINQEQLLKAIRLFDAVVSSLASDLDNPQHERLRRLLIKEFTHWAPLIARACQRSLEAKQAPDALLLLDAALSAIDDPRIHQCLLKKLESAFVRPTHGPLDLKHCKAIGPAIQGLAQAQWWDPTKPCFLQPELRRALLGLLMQSDWALGAELLGQDIARQLNQHLAMFKRSEGKILLFEVCDVAFLLDDLDTLLLGASEHHDTHTLKRVLDWTQELACLSLGETIASTSLRQERCERLHRDCLRLQRAAPTVRMLNSPATLELSCDHLSGKWTVTEHPPADGEGAEHTAPEPSAFIADITRLLQDPEGPPWPLLKELVDRACQASEEAAEKMPWLQWCLLQAGRRGAAQTATQPLEQHLLGLERGTPSGGRKLAHQAFFDGLMQGIRNGLPGPTVQKAISAVQRTSGWRLNVSQRWSLGLALAQRGEPQALSDLLSSDLPSADQVTHAQLEAFLDLCGTLSVQTRTWLLRHARPLFPQHSPLHSQYAQLLPRGPVVPSHSLREVQAPNTFPAPDSGQDKKPLEKPLDLARGALKPWFTIGTDPASQLTVQLSHHKAPQAEQDKKNFEAAVFDWMKLELRLRTMGWPDLMDVIDLVEKAWGPVIDRERLLGLCIEHAQRTNHMGSLLNHLRQRQDAPPPDKLLASLLAIASQPQHGARWRAALIQHLIAWLPTNGGSGAGLHGACAQAIRALPAGELRQNCAQRYQAAFAT